MAMLQNESNPADSNRISVEVDNSDPNGVKLKLKQQSWADNVGWFTQKTITFSPDQACALLRELEQATANAQVICPVRDNIINFPQIQSLPSENPEGIVLKFEKRKRAR